jgi:hypothetical protein
MIRKLFFFGLVLICLIIIAYGGMSMHKVSRISNSRQMRIMVAYNPKYLEQNRHIRDAYVSVLEEEGVAFETIDQHLLLAADPGALAATVPAVIFPDSLCQRMPVGFEPWLASYLGAGGGVAAIYDPAVKDGRDAYLSETLFKRFSGINHVVFHRLAERAYTLGHIKFQDSDAATACEIPFGKLDGSLFLCGYGYGRLQYPVARSQMVADPAVTPAPDVLATAVADDGQAYPAVVTRRYGKGLVFYVNMPLGHLKANADDLPLRSMLRFFLFDRLQIPHLMNVPFGKGGIVLNWHHDANSDWPYLEQMIDAGFFRSHLNYSMHITAGDSLDRPGDKRGFDACGQGERFVKMLMPYGVIGSHGGWHHNWFAFNVESGAFGENEIRRYIQKNSQCLESLTGRKIVEYSAPNGIHPQPLMTQILTEMDISAYYYTGDSGAGPNRTFFDNRMLSDRLIAFPVMPLMDKASPQEFDAAGYGEAAVRQWLQRTVGYAVDNRVVRLLYAHPYDLFETSQRRDFRPAYAALIDTLEHEQANGRLNVQSMSTFAQFMLQMLETEYSFTIRPKALDVFVRKPVGLQGVTLAFPRQKYRPPEKDAWQVQSGIDFFYITLEPSADETRLSIPAR